MGWLIYNQTPACIRDEIARLCTWDNETGRGFPVLISRKGSVWYAAVRSEPATGRLVSGTDASGSFETDATGGYTFAAVFLTRREGASWGYKDMDETAGPVEAGQFEMGQRERFEHRDVDRQRAKPLGNVIELQLIVPLAECDPCVTVATGLIDSDAAEPVPGRRHDVSTAPVKKIADGLQCVSRFRTPYSS